MIFSCDALHYQPTNACNLCTFGNCLMGKPWECYEVRVQKCLVHSAHVLLDKVHLSYDMTLFSHTSQRKSVVYLWDKEYLHRNLTKKHLYVRGCICRTLRCIFALQLCNNRNFTLQHKTLYRWYRNLSCQADPWYSFLLQPLCATTKYSIIRVHILARERRASYPVINTGVTQGFPMNPTCYWVSTVDCSLTKEGPLMYMMSAHSPVCMMKLIFKCPPTMHKHCK